MKSIKQRNFRANSAPAAATPRCASTNFQFFNQTKELNCFQFWLHLQVLNQKPLNNISIALPKLNFTI